MDLPEPDIQSIMLELSAFLERIQEELHMHGQDLQNTPFNQEELEDYLLDVNSYYYQSFHNRFFPLYRAKIEDDAKKLYRIGREESALKEDIIKNLKRVALLYNHIKIALQVLQSNRIQVESLQLGSLRSKEQSLLEMMYALKDLQFNMHACLDTLNDYKSCMKNKQLLESLRTYPFQPSLKDLFLIWDEESNSFGRDYKRLMINLELYLQLLSKLSASDDKTSDKWDTWFAELHKIEDNLANKKYSPSLNSWYKQHIRQQFLMYQELLELNIKQRDRKRVSNAASNFEKYLNALLYLLEKVNRRSGKEEMVLLELYLLSSADLSLINEVTALFNQALKKLQELIKQHTDASNPDFSVFSNAAGKIISELLTQYNILLSNATTTDYIILLNVLDRFKNKLSFLEIQINHLTSRDEYEIQLQQQYELALETMDRYKNQLSEIKNQLSRTLAPRNMSRQFKDMKVRVEHIPINQGEAFPPAYTYLLDIAVEQNEPQQIILEEDGDIFLFRLDDFTDEIIPKIILGKDNKHE